MNAVTLAQLDKVMLHNRGKGQSLKIRGGRIVDRVPIRPKSFGSVMECISIEVWNTPHPSRNVNTLNLSLL
jgi:hypothetical protein